MSAKHDPKSAAIRNGIIGFAIVAAVVLVEARYIFENNSRAVKSKWNENLDQAFADSKKSGKPVLVDFNATWCGPCQEYKDQLFNTAAFAAKAKDFELVDVDTDQQPALSSQYKVGAIPDIRIFDSDGNEIKKVIGYEGPTLLVDMDAALQSIRSKKQG